MKFNMKKLGLTLILTLSLFALVLTGCSSNSTEKKAETSEKPAATLRVFAAASLKESLNAIQKDFEAKENCKLEFNLAASGTLANQIIQADVADVFISASKSHMKIVADKDMATDQVDLFKNKLALITPKDSTTIKSAEDLSKAKKIALGETKSVPVGKYSEEALTKLKLWDSMNKDKKIVFGKDVKAVLNYVELGEVDAGIVYESDAKTSDKVNVVTTLDEALHSPIIYPATVIKNSPQKDLAAKFIKYIQENPEKFEQNGFIVIK